MLTPIRARPATIGLARRKVRRSGSRYRGLLSDGTADDVADDVVDDGVWALMMDVPFRWDRGNESTALVWLNPIQHDTAAKSKSTALISRNVWHTDCVARTPTARELARADTNREILRVGREQLEAVGAAALSLRAVARELGMVSSAIYRYVANRDDLLTRLIDDAYNSLGEAVEADVAATAVNNPARRWVSAALVIRSWAIDHRHEYSLLYGSPVPGYAAPQQTAVSGTRATRALITIVADAVQANQLTAGDESRGDISPDLSADFDILRTTVDLEVSDAVVLDVLIAWSQLFGLISFELFNQTRGIVEHHEMLFEASAWRLANLVGLA